MRYHLKKRFRPTQWHPTQKITKSRPTQVVISPISNLSNIRKPMSEDISNNDHFQFSYTELLNYFIMEQNRVYDRLPYHLYIEYAYEAPLCYYGIPTFLRSEYLDNLANRLLIRQDSASAILICVKHNYARSVIDRRLTEFIGYIIATVIAQYRISQNNVFMLDEILDRQVVEETGLSEFLRDTANNSDRPEYKIEACKYFDKNVLMGEVSKFMRTN